MPHDRTRATFSSTSFVEEEKRKEFGTLTILIIQFDNLHLYFSYFFFLFFFYDEFRFYLKKKEIVETNLLETTHKLSLLHSARHPQVLLLDVGKNVVGLTNAVVVINFSIRERAA